MNSLRSKLAFLGIILSYAFIFPAAASVNDCNEISPSYKSIESYNNIDSNYEITPKQEKQFSKFIKRIAGNWVGAKNYFDCIGSANEPRIRSLQTEVEAEIKNTSNNTLSINYEAYSTKTKSTKHVRFSSVGKGSISHIEFPSRNKLIFSEKHRMSTSVRTQYSHGNSHNILVENFYTLELKHKKLFIEITSFRNGYFASYEKWKMK